MMVTPDSGCTMTDTWGTDDTPSIGATWNSTVWLQGAGSTATVTLSSGANSRASTVKLTGSYQAVTLSLPITSTPGPLQLSLAASGATAYVDDVSITQTGLALVDDWTESTTGSYVGVFGVDDSTAAYDGSGYLYLTNTGSSTANVYLDDDSYTPVIGTAHEMSFWYRSLAGSGNGAATLETLDSSGNVLDTYTVNFPAAPTSTWEFVYLSLPITKSTAVTMRTQIGMPGGATFAIDDVESRDVNSWSALQPKSGKASITIIDGVADAADGMNYLRTTMSAAGGGVTDTITVDTDGDAISVTAGETYQLQAYVRSTTGASIGGTLSLATGAGDRVGANFTATADWTAVEVELTATQSATSLIPQVTLSTAGQLDVDALTLIPVLIEQSDPWSPIGGGVKWQVVEDPANAHDSSYGVMEFTASQPNTGVQHAVDQSSNVGDEFSVNAWVRSSSATTPVSGFVQVTTVGGSNEVWKQNFTADDTWTSVSIPMTIAQAGHTGFEVAVFSSTTNVMVYLDDVTMQQNLWTASAGATQTIVYDGASAQSGTSYMELSYTGSGSGSSYYDMPASEDIGNVYAAGTTWIVTAYLKSSSATALASGQLSLSDPASSSTPQSFSVGEEWTAVTASYTVGSSDLDDLRVQVSVSGSSVPVDVDSITISDGTPPPDGITTPLPHPDSGYLYLWDEAFGIPGAHLWAASAQVDFSDGLPGLGVSATLYQDPTKMSSIMMGTDWIKGDMAVNFSESDPCFLFDFDTTGDSGISVGGGVFTATDFSIDFAPQGCQVGSYTLTQGAAISFDGSLGDAAIYFDMAITEDENGPVFSEDIGITDMTLGGIDFKESELSIYMSTTDDSVSLVSDMVLSAGTFDGSYDLTVNEDELQMDGDVSLTDWSFAGGGFDVQEFDFDMSMTVPFGSGTCGSFSTDTSGLMEMASKTSLSFTGDIAIDCGELKTLLLEYDYSHGGISETFELDYDSDTGELAGGVSFTFNRSTSWKFWFHRYNRHPYFNISLDYSMDVNDPASTLEATLSGTVSVSGGSGSLSCTLVAGSGTDWADDQCSLEVDIKIGGGHTYKASW